MEEKKTFKIKKPYLIIFTIAIVFAIMGVIDLKVNAAESLVEDIPVEEQYMQVDYYLYDYVNEYYERFTYNWSNPSSRIAIYYGDFTDKVLDPSNTNNVIESTGKGYRLCVARDENNSTQYWYGSSTYTKYDSNEVQTSFDTYDRDYDISLFNADEYVPIDTPNFKDLGTYVRSMKEVAGLSINTNIPKFTDWDCLLEYLETGYYDPSGVVIDYDTSKYVYDDTMPVPEDISHSIEVIHTSDDDAYTRFVLVNWKNTSNEYYIEVQLQPYANISSMYLPFGHFISGEKFKADYEFYGDWEYFDLLEKGTSRKFYPVNQLLYDNLDYFDWFQELKSTYFTSYMENVEGKRFNTGLSYRIRYVDVANKKAGKWLSVVMSDYYDGFHVFVQDDLGNTLDESEFENGFVNVQDQLGSSDSIDTDIVKDNANDRQDYFDEYGGVSNGDIDLNGATNWLTSVANFIKGTPDFVGSVMSFLPEPVRYGMFVCLFLGVIASGYAIVKALI